MQKNDNQSGALNNAKVQVLVNPDNSWVVCHIYKKKKKHMPSVIAQVYNIPEGEQVPFYNLSTEIPRKRVATTPRRRQTLEGWAVG